MQEPLCAKAADARAPLVCEVLLLTRHVGAPNERAGFSTPEDRCLVHPRHLVTPSGHLVSLGVLVSFVASSWMFAWSA